MKILQLIKHLSILWVKYGNRKIYLIVENDDLQMEDLLSDIAYAPRDKSIKLLSKGFK